MRREYVCLICLKVLQNIVVNIPLWVYCFRKGRIPDSNLSYVCFLFPYLHILVYTIVIYIYTNIHLKTSILFYLLWKLKTLTDIGKMGANSTVNPTTTNTAIPTKSSITKVSSSKLFHCLIGFTCTFFERWFQFHSLKHG
jgi:hypothetical protein